MDLVPRDKAVIDQCGVSGLEISPCFVEFEVKILGRFNPDLELWSG